MINPINFILYAITLMCLGGLMVAGVKLLLQDKQTWEIQHTPHAINFNDYETRTVEDLV